MLVVLAALAGCAGPAGVGGTRIASLGQVVPMPSMTAQPATQADHQGCGQTLSFVDNCSGFPRYDGP